LAEYFINKYNHIEKKNLKGIIICQQLK